METESHYSKHASLALVARRFEKMKLWSVVREEVRIDQKVVRYEPLDKLLDCLINILVGGRGLIEINTRVRSDRALQWAFGRSGCAEQSTISQTLDACTTTNVVQMRAAMKRVVQQHGQVRQHPVKEWLLLDVDTLGMVAGEQGEGVTKGYFSAGRDQRGRQLGRVLATEYDEVIVERLYDGKRQLEHSLLDLVAAAEDTLHLQDADRPENTVWRVDAGGGTDDNIPTGTFRNPLLRRGYQVLTKAHNWKRAVKLAASVKHWECDPKTGQRDVGWVTLPHPYVRPTRQLIIRTVTKTGKIRHRVLISTLSDEQLCDCFKLDVSTDTPWPMVYAYDLRGGGIETQNRCDRQGLGLGHRNKRAFAAQEMLVLLGQLAHNFLIWMRNELAHTDPRFAHYGLKRMVRDVSAIDGVVHFDPDQNVIRVELNPQHPLSAAVSTAFGQGYV